MSFQNYLTLNKLNISLNLNIENEYIVFYEKMIKENRFGFEAEYNLELKTIKPIKKFVNKIKNKFIEYEESDLDWLQYLYKNVNFYEDVATGDVIYINSIKFLIVDFYIQYPVNNIIYYNYYLKAIKF